MRNRILKFTLLLSIILLITGLENSTYATHAAGSDIKYRCLGGLMYEIEVTFYRDCDGVNEPASITVNCKSNNGSSNFNVTASKVTGTNGVEITVPCAGSSSTCGGGSSTGIRKWTYRATVTLPSAQTDWVFSYSVCCRNCTISTISNPCGSNSNLYVEAKLNNVLAPCNSSPTFSNIPIAFVCVGQNFNYNHGVLDPDGDSLVYSLITPKTSSSANVSFIAPASVNSPIASSTPFGINTSTGDLNFTPSQLQIGVMAILVREYRNGQLIGSIIRDMQVYTQTCTNTLPTASGINGTGNYSVTVCPGQQVCFTVNSVDADATQNVTLTTNNGIAGATYTISGGSRPTLTFCWTPTNADIGLLPNTFTVTVRDNACPNNGIQTFSFNIYVPSPYFNIAGTNISCNGATTGTATATPVITSTYNYAWSNGGTTSSISGLTAGTYSVTVTDPSSGCTASQNVTLTEPSGMTISSSATQPSCANRSNGAIDISVSGGNSPYSYSWSNGATTQDLGSVPAGTYTVTVTDGNGCTKTNTTTLSNSYAVTLSASASQANCFGQNSGSVTTSVGGGVSPYTYSWNTGATSNALSNVVAGTYSVTVTDQNGCTAVTSASVTQPAAALSLSINATQVNCFGQSTGALTTSVTGGTTPYTYSWNTGATTSGISNLNAGTYSVTVTDSRGCTITQSGTVSQPLAALTASSSAAAVNCFGQNTGSITLNASGGTTPYSIVWSNGSTSQNLSGLAAGTYTATITDQRGCTSLTSAIVTQPSAALSSSATASSVACFGGNNGSILLTVSGGTTPYNYNWSNGASTQNLSGLTAGTYTVTVTDVNNCVSTVTAIQVTQPSAALNATTSSTAALCFGSSTGTISVSPSGGTTPYTYNWNTGATTQNLSNLTSGTYTVTITDARNCQSIKNITVTQPAAAVTVSTTKTEVRCFGNSTGIATASGAGGTAPYTYLWNTGATTASINTIPAGVYTVTVTDVNGCSTGTSITILQPAAPLSLSGNATNIVCFDIPTGSIIASATGGTSPYSYLWNNGNSSPTLSSLASGTYTVTATDAYGCTSSQSYTLTQPVAPLSGSLSATAAACNSQNSGAISTNINGGTTPYSYSWSNGSTASSLNSITAGTYTVTVTDANGCSIVRTTIVNQPAAALSATLSKNDVSCFGNNSGSLAANPAGGTSPYNYLWSTGFTTQAISSLSIGTYTVTVTDANGCTVSASSSIQQPAAALQLSATNTDVNCTGNSIGSIDLSVSGGTTPYSYLWNNGSSTQDITNLSANTYTVIVTDAQGCTAQLSRTISQPVGALNVTSSAVNILCFGGTNGSINVTATAGTPPYSYIWSTGATTEDLNSLPAGNYTVTVTDNNGCSMTNDLFVTQPSAALSSSNTNTAVLCFGNSTGAIDINVTGGTSPYTYLWSNGATSADLVNMTAGSYSVTITDANGCTTTDQSTITQPAATLNATSAITNLNCTDVMDGAVQLSVSGGTAPYNYQWDNGATSSGISNLNPGVYTVNISDQNGCTFTSSYTISFAAAQLTANTQAAAALCHGDATGSAILTVNGGTAPYTYNWSSGQMTQNLSNVTSGTYAVTITDANGCSTSAQTSIGEPVAVLAGATSSTDILCNGNATGQIDLSVNGGTYPYTYSWSNGGNSEDQASLVAGNYTVIVTDANGCTTSNTVTINQPAAALNLALTPTDVNCFGESTGSIQSIVGGGTSPYTYSWNGQNGNNDLTQIPAGNYSLFITDANGCTIQQTATIHEPAAALAASTQLINIDCNGNSSGTANLQISGGTSPYTYIWSNGNTQSSVNNLVAGTYNYTITDANGCQLSGTVDLTEPTAPLSLTHSQKDADCYGDATGSIDLTPAGGTPGYTYLWNDGTSNEDLINLTAGSYTVTVTDINNCVSSQTFTIVQPTAAISISDSLSMVNCNNGQDASIQLTVNGGTAPYIYTWNNGANGASLSNINAGSYSVLITDQHGCTSSQSYTITEPAMALNATTATTAVLCFGNATGQIDLQSTGGTAPYSYSWSNGETTEDLNNLPAGIYTVTVTDANNCVFNINAEVIQPTATLSTSSTENNVSCKGDASGAITLTTTGGTAPYTYQWNNGGTVQNPSGMNAGTYSVTVTDMNGCTASKTITLTEPDSSIAASMSIGHVSCNGQPTGWIDLTVSGGTGTYTYLWNTGGTVQDPTQMAAGNYEVLITDQNGCTATLSGLVTEPAAFPRVSGVTSPVSCKGMQNGGVEAIVYGGTFPFTYLWNTGATTQILTNQPAGIYIVTVTDGNGCSAQYSTQIMEPGESITANGNSIHANCITGQMGSVFMSPSGGVSPYTYLWNTGSNAQNLTGQIPGTYSVTVFDANGCELTQSYTIEDQSVLSIAAAGDPQICMGQTIMIGADSIPNATYQWYYNGAPLQGATSNNFVTPVAGTYTMTAITACGTYTSNPVEITVRTLSNVSINNSVIICKGESAQLTAGGGNEYKWTPTTGLNYDNIPNPVASPTQTTEYTVVIKDGYGCTATASVTVSVLCDTLDIPNGFSPNNDGTNDTFVIDGIDQYPGNVLFIYNRWGNLVYKKKEYANEWDGRSNVNGVMFGEQLPNGTYYYILDLNLDQKPINGFVVLRR